jgi:lipopolysaccharide/colanic/teichoic acid biosynthesis glycosyltransferase
MKPGACVVAHKEHVVDLIRSDKPMRKLDQMGDPRLILNGAILRATGLDELPQLINVIMGDMSFVGPRPCTPYEFEHYLPYHRRRCETLPGLTGLWQISGKNNTTFSEMIRQDIYYVDYCSLWMDFKIIGKTFGVLVDQVRQVEKSS